MSRLHTSFVLGFHGCDRAVADKAVSGKLDLLLSDHDYDWLGPGIYFWEADRVRAQEWAAWKASRGDYKDPVVVGAVIDLRHCLDLANREDLELVSWAFDSFKRTQEEGGLSLPVNKGVGSDPDGDKLLRYLDCAVIKHLHGHIERQPPGGFPDIGKVDPFDTVRGIFEEGGELFPGSEFRKQTHVQIAVRNSDCIRGIFHPR